MMILSKTALREEENIKNASPLCKINNEILQTLISACRRKDEITILYNSPSSSKKEIDVLTDKLYIANNKIYLSGISSKYNKTARFLVSRILQIPTIKLTKTIEIKIDTKRVSESEFIKYKNSTFWVLFF